MRIEKIVEKLKNSKADADFDDLAKILEYLGYICNKKNGGSHFIFKKENKRVNIPKHKPIKKPYVRNVLQVYEEEKNGKK